MAKYNVGVSMGIKSCRIEDVLDIEDDATEDEVERQIREWAMGHIEFWGTKEGS